MQVRQIPVFSHNRKRQILALSFVAISAGGCASGPVQPNRTHSAASPHAAVSGVSGVAT